MRRLSVILATSLTALAQAPTAPVVNPRGVVNAFTQQPAPSVVARGGILHINGLNLGPPGGIAPATLPLPTKVGSPEIEVLINGTAAPILSAAPERIVAQVPVDAAAGVAEVVVRKGDARSRPARCLIQAIEPAVRSANDSGFGPVAGSMSGRTLAITAAGLGPTDPRVDTGAAAGDATPAKPAALLNAYIGGIKANASAALSTKRVGEFDVQIEVPDSARPGDLVTLTVQTQNAMRAANRTVFQGMRSPDVQYLPLPEGAPELRALADPDLNGNYLVGASARARDGCYSAWVFDLARKKSAKAADCLTTANANALTPVVAPAEGAVLAALVGPPPADAQPGMPISAKVQIFNPAMEQPLAVDLPSPAAGLTGLAGEVEAQIPGTPPQCIPIDGQTGELRDPGPCNLGGGGAGLGQVLGGAFTVDVDGLKSILSAPVGLVQGRVGLIVGDDADAPKKAKFAVLNLATREVVSSQDFPDGWLPLLAPRAPARPGPGGGPGGGPALQIPRQPVSWDVERRVLYALARTGDNGRHGLAAFTLDGNPAKAIEFPDGKFAAACSPQIRFFSLDLSRRLVLYGGNAPEAEVKDPCPALGFLQVDLATQAVSFVPIQGEGQFNGGLGGTAGELNDFVYGANTSAAPQSRADTLHVLDGVTSSTFRLDLPAGLISFQAPQPVAQLNWLIAVGTNRQPGDAGLVIFDLDRAEARTLPIPDGFASMTQAGVFLATRKLVARGIKNGATGSQFLIYDLITGDLMVVPNPDGVAWVGPPPAQGPAQPGQPGAQIQQAAANAKANTVAAFTYGDDRKQNGVVVVRVP
ncbi:MAG: IPT/TIG domain-containing protein [Acidobacteria bacterium]|nr:IPT/TIG domain-containing protein [Acidobacteriota bacterium]